MHLEALSLARLPGQHWVAGMAVLIAISRRDADLRWSDISNRTDLEVVCMCEPCRAFCVTVAISST